MDTSQKAPFVFLIFLIAAGTAFAQKPKGPHGPIDDVLEQSLRTLRIDPTQDGLRQVLAPLPVDQKQIEAWIEQLGAERFNDREHATKALIAVPNIPPGLLEAQVRDDDPERSARAKQILQARTTNPRHINAIRFIRVRNWKALKPQLLYFAAAAGPIGQEAREALQQLADPTDFPQVTALRKDENPYLRATAILMAGKATPKLADAWAAQARRDPSRVVRIHANAVRPGKLANKTEYAESLWMATRLLRNTLLVNDQTTVEERRELNRLHLAASDALVAADLAARAEHRPIRAQIFMNYGLDTSERTDILLYRIKWFSGKWSNWYAPGFNDRELKKNRSIRHWACFNDHSFEVLTSKDETFRRVVWDTETGPKNLPAKP